MSFIETTLVVGRQGILKVIILLFFHVKSLFWFKTKTSTVFKELLTLVRKCFLCQIQRSNSIRSGHLYNFKIIVFNVLNVGQIGFIAI